MEIRKVFRAEIAHRLSRAYTTRCLGVHGHSYKFEIFVKSDTLDENEMVMDFKLLKERANKFLDCFDHTLLIEEDDSFLVQNASALNPRYMIVPYNTTAENISSHIYSQLKKLGLPINKVIVHETEDGCAICEEENMIDLSKVYFSEALGFIA